MENDDFSEEKYSVQTSAQSAPSVQKRTKESCPQPPEDRAQRRKEKADPSTDLSLLFSSSNQPAAPASAPPRTLGGASKPRRKNSAQARFVPALLARTWPRSKPVSFCVKQLVPPRRQSAGDRFCLPVGHRTEWPLL